MTKEQEIKLGESMGFTAVEDKRRGFGWPKFIKGELHVWLIREGWQTSYLSNGYFTNHKKFETLKEALNRTD